MGSCPLGGGPLLLPADDPFAGGAEMEASGANGELMIQPTYPNATNGPIDHRLTFRFQVASSDVPVIRAPRRAKLFYSSQFLHLLTKILFQPNLLDHRLFRTVCMFKKQLMIRLF
jgi:hypothetical protein